MGFVSTTKIGILLVYQQTNANCFYSTEYNDVDVMATTGTSINASGNAQ